MYPNRLNQYVAGGKPVVSTDLPEVGSFKDVVAIARDRAEFLVYIEMSLGNTRQEAVTQRVKVAKENPVESRAEVKINMLEALGRWSGVHMFLNSYLFGWRKLNIRKSDRVLEVGSGNRPYIRSDVLCDKYFGGQDERGGPILVDRPFVVCDVTALPFADNSFDYVICTHVAEHVDEPEKVFEELMRVSKRGYIETPNRYCENMAISGFPKSQNDVNSSR